jgi:hypothetical protein
MSSLRRLAFLPLIWLCACSSKPAGSPSTGGSGGAAGADAGSGGTPGDASSDAPAAPYTINAFDNVRIGSDSSKPNFQNATADIDLEDGPFASVKLIIDLGTTCYPFDSWQNDPPPAGQNWPADCDAFDRNFEFSLDDPADPKVGPPAIELVRAITPFGGPEHLEVDITDVANGLPGKHTLRTHISTYSDAAGKVSGSNGGWNVTAKIEVVPGKAPRNVLAVVPLYNGSEGATDVITPPGFDVPAGTTSARIEYRATGHGGAAGDLPACQGPAEEFCHRTDTMSVDGATVSSFDPWRIDCDKLCTLKHQNTSAGGFDYCLENPCGAIASVKASRANWCPGSMTPPYLVTSKAAPALIAAGQHTFSWKFSNIADGGTWRLSATYFAFGD